MLNEIINYFTKDYYITGRENSISCAVDLREINI